MDKSIDDELVAEILREVKAWYPNAFNNPKNYPEDMDNLKTKICKLLINAQKFEIKMEEVIGFAANNFDEMSWAEKSDFIKDWLKSQNIKVVNK